MIGGPLLVLTGTVILFGGNDPSSTLHGLQGIATIPEAAWELFLGVYCTIWGFRPDAPILSEATARRPPGRAQLGARRDDANRGGSARPGCRDRRVRGGSGSWPSRSPVRPLFLVGWFASGGVTPHYTASDQDWTNWAHDNKWNGRISGFTMLLAAFVFLYFMSAFGACLGVQSLGFVALRNLGGSCSRELSSVSAGMSMAIVIMAAASSEGANADPVVSRAVTAGAAGPFLVAAMGFAAFLIAAGVLTLRTRVFPRWTASSRWSAGSRSSSRS